MFLVALRRLCVCAFYAYFCVYVQASYSAHGTVQVAKNNKNNVKYLQYLEYVFRMLTGPGCRRKPANCTAVNGTNSLPTIGGFSITLRSVLFSCNYITWYDLQINFFNFSKNPSTHQIACGVVNAR